MSKEIMQSRRTAKPDTLPDTIDTRRVIEMIKNADLYDLINVSLKKGELSNESVENFIYKQLDKQLNDKARKQEESQQARTRITKDKRKTRSNELMMTPPKKSVPSGKRSTKKSMQIFNDENTLTLSDLMTPTSNNQIKTPLNQFTDNSSTPIRPEPLQKSQVENSPTQRIHSPQDTQKDNSSADKNETSDLKLPRSNPRHNQTIKEEQQEDEEDSQEYYEMQRKAQAPTPVERPISPYSEQNYSSTRVFDQVSIVHHDSFNQDPYIDHQQLEILTNNSSNHHRFVLEPIRQIDQVDFNYNSSTSLRQKPQQENSYYQSQSPTHKLYQSVGSRREESFGVFNDLASPERYDDFGKKFEKPANLALSDQKAGKEVKPSVFNKKYYQQAAEIKSTKLQHNSQNKALNRSVSTQAIKTLNTVASRQSKLTNQTKDSREVSRNSLSRNMSFQSNIVKTQNVVKPQHSLTRIASSLLPQAVPKTPEHGQKEQEVFQAPLTQRDLVKKQALQLANNLLKKGSTDVKKQQMLNCFPNINLGLLVELERIKKPSPLMLSTCAMFCMFVNLFKDRPLDVDLSNWTQVQSYLGQYVAKCITELMASIKTKVLTDFTTVSHSQRQYIISSLREIKQEFFTGEHVKQFKHISTNKNLKTIVSFVYNVINYVLEGQEESSKVPKSNSVMEYISFSNDVQPIPSTEDSTPTLISHDYMDPIVSSRKVQYKNGVSSLSNSKRNASSSLASQRGTASRNINKGSRNINVSPLPESKSFAISRDPYERASEAPKIKHKFIKSHITRKPSSPQSSKNVQPKSNKNALRVDVKELKKDYPSTQNLQTVGQSRRVSSKKDGASVVNKTMFDGRSPFRGFHHHQQTRQQQQVLSRSNSDFINSSQPSARIEKNKEILKELDKTMETEINESDSFDKFDYRVMLENSTLSLVIKNKAAEIEQNMLSSRPDSKVDMTLIEELKQRRRDQSKQREETASFSTSLRPAHE